CRLYRRAVSLKSPSTLAWPSRTAWLLFRFLSFSRTAGCASNAGLTGSPALTRIGRMKSKGSDQRNMAYSVPRHYGAERCNWEGVPIRPSGEQLAYRCRAAFDEIDGATVTPGVLPGRVDGERSADRGEEIGGVDRALLDRVATRARPANGLTFGGTTIQRQSRNHRLRRCKGESPDNDDISHP